MTNETQPLDSYQTQCWDKAKIIATTQPTAVDVLTYSSTSTSLPENCGLVIVDVTSAANNAYCIACRAGYSIGSYDATTVYKVATCVAITSCTNNTNKALNRCSNCVYSYDTVTDTISTVASTNCIAPKQGNCFAGVMSGATLTCHVCDPGYELMNGKCLIIKIPSCKDGKSNIFDTFN